MELYKLTVNVVSNTLPATDARYSIVARSETTTTRWTSTLLNAEQYRRAMRVTGLTANQIESPITSGGQTEFGGIGHGDMLFREDVLLRMGLQKQKTSP